MTSPRMIVQVCAQRGQIRASHADLVAIARVGAVYLLEIRYKLIHMYLACEK
jgi:hypothetical protein